MKKAVLLSLLVLVVLLAVGMIAEAQQPAKIPRIGILLASSASSFRPGSKHFANGCASLAMSKGKTLSLSIDMQKGNSNGCLTLQPSWSVSKLTSSSPSGPAILAAKKASATIPIVFAAACRSGRSWACLQPGTTRREYHRTFHMAPDLDGKRLELLKEAFPKVARVAFLWVTGGRGENCLSQRWRLRPRCWESNFYRLRC